MDPIGAIAGFAGILSSAQLLRKSLGRARPRSASNPRRQPPTRVLLAGQGPPRGTIHSVRNIDQRVKKIEEMICKGRSDPRIRGLAVKAVSRKCGNKFCIPERDYMGEVREVFNFVRKNQRYVRDAVHMDQFQHPVRTLQFGGGDCDDYTILLGSMLQSIGYPVRMRVVQTSRAPDFDHIYLMAGIPPHAPRQMVPLDASVAKPAGWQPPRRMLKRVRDYEVR